jgi:hypothetical protein
MANLTSPRDAVTGINPLTPAVPTPQPKPGAAKKKRGPSKPQLMTKIPPVPASLPKKPRVPALMKPLSGGTGEANPDVVPRNSQRGVKQRLSFDPGTRL